MGQFNLLVPAVLGCLEHVRRALCIRVLMFCYCQYCFKVGSSCMVAVKSWFRMGIWGNCGRLWMWRYSPEHACNRKAKLFNCTLSDCAFQRDCRKTFKLYPKFLRIFAFYYHCQQVRWCTSTLKYWQGTGMKICMQPWFIASNIWK